VSDIFTNFYANFIMGKEKEIISDQQWGSKDCRHFHYFQLKMMLCDAVRQDKF
jgi:hypothetical protein